MPITEDTPQASKGFKALQYAMFRHGPKRLSEVVLNGKRLRAMTASRKHRG